MLRRNLSVQLSPWKTNLGNGQRDRVGAVWKKRERTDFEGSVCLLDKGACREKPKPWGNRRNFKSFGEREVIWAAMGHIEREEK